MAKIKYKYIKEWGEHEKLALQAMAKSGGATYDQLLELGFSKQRIKNFCTDKVFERKAETVEKEVDGKKVTETRTRLVLNTNGKKEVKRRGYAYAHQKANSYEHDRKVFSTTLNLLNQCVAPENILNESEQRKRFGNEIHQAQSQGKEFRVCDLVVSEGESIVAVEIVTENYDSREIAEHKVYAEVINAGYREV